jgi:hypothetical protein
MSYIITIILSTAPAFLWGFVVGRRDRTRAHMPLHERAEAEAKARYGRYMGDKK